MRRPWELVIDVDRTAALPPFLQRSSADLRLNPHIHAVFLDGAWHEQEDDLVFAGLGHLRTSEVGDVLEHTIRRIEKHLRRRGVLLGTRTRRSTTMPKRASLVRPCRVRLRRQDRSGRYG